MKAVFDGNEAQKAPFFNEKTQETLPCGRF